MPIQNKRILSILKILNKHKKAISGENLANLIGVSRSTIRRDIKDLNSSIQKYGAHILSEAGNGGIRQERQKYPQLLTTSVFIRTASSRHALQLML